MKRTTLVLVIVISMALAALPCYALEADGNCYIVTASQSDKRTPVSLWERGGEPMHWLGAVRVINATNTVSSESVSPWYFCTDTPIDEFFASSKGNMQVVDEEKVRNQSCRIVVTDFGQGRGFHGFGPWTILKAAEGELLDQKGRKTGDPVYGIVCSSDRKRLILEFGME